MALREVNLIPGERIERRTLRRHAALWLCGLAVAALATALVGFGHGAGSTGGAQAGQQAAQGQSATLAAQARQIEQGKAEVAYLRRERQQLAELTARRRSFASVLERLSDTANDKTRLQSLTLSTEAGARLQLALTGSSRSHEQLGAFLEGLAREPAFRDVALKSALEEPARSAGETGVLFQIECGIAKEAP